LAEWPYIASLIDGLMMNVIETDKPVDQLTREAENRASALYAPVGS
jgi:hypothetical protein